MVGQELCQPGKGSQQAWPGVGAAHSEQRALADLERVPQALVQRWDVILHLSQELGIQMRVHLQAGLVMAQAAGLVAAELRWVSLLAGSKGSGVGAASQPGQQLCTWRRRKCMMLVTSLLIGLVRSLGDSGWS